MSDRRSPLVSHPGPTSGTPQAGGTVGPDQPYAQRRDVQPERHSERGLRSEQSNRLAQHDRYGQRCRHGAGAQSAQTEQDPAQREQDASCRRRAAQCAQSNDEVTRPDAYRTGAGCSAADQQRRSGRHSAMGSRQVGLPLAQIKDPVRLLTDSGASVGKPERKSSPSPRSTKCMIPRLTSIQARHHFSALTQMASFDVD